MNNTKKKTSIKTSKVKMHTLSRHNPTHETVKECGGIFNKIDNDGMIVCAKCGDTLLDYFDELADKI